MGDMRNNCKPPITFFSLFYLYCKEKHMAILKVNGNIVNNEYLEQQANAIMAEVDNELNSYKEFKREVQQDLQESKDRVDYKLKKAYS